MRGTLEPGAFGQANPTDGRTPLDWKSKYEPEAQREILREAIYLGLLLAFIPFLMILFWLEYPKRLLGLPDYKYDILVKYGCAWLCGTLGGTLYDLKWLYHVVARKLWHMDRRLWRVFTPHISGGLAFAVLALISSGLLRIFDANATQSYSLIIGISFLVGYFSDSAFAKLMEIAETLFGSVQSKEKHVRVDDSEEERKQTQSSGRVVEAPIDDHTRTA